MEYAEVTTGAPDAESPSPWIMSGWIDLLLICGGLPWLLAGTNALLQTTRSERMLAGLSVLGVVLTYLFSNPHTMATLVRVSWTEEARARFRFYASTLVLPCLALCAVGLAFEQTIPILLLAYLVWVIQHYSSQCYGITLIYCYKRGYPLGGTHKTLIRLLYQLTAAVAILRRFTWPDWGARYFLSYHVPEWGPLPAPILAVTTAGLALVGAANVIQTARTAIATRRMIPAPALVLIGSTVSFLLMSGWFSGLVWLYVPAVFHGSQYLAVAASYHFKDTPRAPTRAIMWDALRSSAGGFYLLLLVLGGAFIYVGMPRILEEMGLKYSAAMASIFAVVNFHHFVTDRAIWRLRDPRTREILLA